MTKGAITVAGVLVGAAAHIERYGLHKNYYWPGLVGNGVPPYEWGTPCCAVGAMGVAAFPGDPRMGIGLIGVSVEHLSAYLCAARLDSDGFITLWNDELERTAAEVVRVLRDAAQWKSGEVIIDGHEKAQRDEPSTGQGDSVSGTRQ